MWNFLRRRLLWFLIGFVTTFVVYLFIRYDMDQILLGMAIAGGGGAVLTAAIFFLERKFPDEPKTAAPNNQRT